MWNYRRGDGVEKAVLLANVLRARHPDEPVTLDIRPDLATVASARAKAAWPSNKVLTHRVVLGEQP